MIFGLTDRNFSVYRQKHSQKFRIYVKMCQNFVISGQNLIKIVIFGLTDWKFSVYEQKYSQNLIKTLVFRTKFHQNCDFWFDRSKFFSL